MIEGTKSLFATKALRVGFAIGVLITVPALITALASGAAGHGHYVAARALFPIPLLLTPYEGDTIGPVSIAIGLLQFPIYGAVLGRSIDRRNYLPGAVMIAAHVLAAIDCFSGTLPNFS